MFRIAFVLAVTASTSALASPIKVYIIAGQSNATGASAQALLEPELWPPQENLYQFAIHTATANPTTVYYHESENWEQLRILDALTPGPDPYPGTNYGSELSFGQAMKRRLGEKIAIIKTAANGTSLAGQWLPGLNNLYPWMIDKVQSSLGQLETLGYEPSVSGFLWIQHEGDAQQAVTANSYDDNLLAFASAVRTDLGFPTLPFLINQAHINLARTYTTVLRQSQANAVAADPFMRMFSADDLALNPDNVHFTGTTHQEVGRRFADLLVPSGDFNNDGVVNGSDLAAWQGSVANNRIGDGDSDGVADGADFLLWQRQLSGSPGVTAIQEPGSLALVLFGSLLSLKALRCIDRSGGKTRSFSVTLAPPSRID